MGFQGGLWEPRWCVVLPTGKASVFTGTNPHGQGEETTFAQLVGQELGIPLADIEVVHGDTAPIPLGWGTYGSRSTPVGGTAILLAARKVTRRRSGSPRICWKPRPRISSSRRVASTSRGAQTWPRRSRRSR